METHFAKVNKIIDFSCVDGPGNRSVIFLQGCNFNCWYCHNPETIHECSQCKKCVAVCPVGALTWQTDKVSYEIQKCVLCDACIKCCPHNSSPRIRNMTAEQVMEAIRPSRPFIRGITISGGECTRWRDFLVELLALAKADELNVLLDSNGSYDFENDLELLERIDGVMLDIKAFDREAHVKLTGKPNDMVLKNAVFLAKYHKLPEIRTVILPEDQDTTGIVEQIGNLLEPFLKETPIRYKLIKYRPIGVRAEYKMQSTPSDEKMQQLEQLAYQKGFQEVIII